MLKFARPGVAILTLLSFALLSTSALAGGPVFWEVSKADDFLKGDAHGVSISDAGAISLAPSYTLVYDTKEAYIWSATTDAAGNIYLGTGHDGKIFKVDAAGNGRLLYDAPELDVTALATDSKGNLYAATSPDGKIYKITADGNATPLFKPPYKYVWSLVYDEATSNLYAGTGDKGVIYKIDASGKEKVIASTKQANITSLVLDKGGNLIAGTEPGGLVLRVSPDGKTFALLDTPTQEIHALTVAPDGAIYALGVAQQGAAQKTTSVGTSSTSTLSSEGVVKLSTEEEGTVTVQTAESSSNTSSAKSTGKGSTVFRIQPDGTSETVWNSNDTIAFSMRLLKNGNLLVGTGTKGRIYAVAPDESKTLLIQSPEDQTSALLAVGDTLYGTSSNLGRLYRIGTQTVGEGTYISTVRDTKFTGRWGMINWRGAGGLQIQTRTGNTETPDLTWSDWSQPYTRAGGEQITSPRARFIQWKVTLKGASQIAATKAGTDHSTPVTRLEAVTIAYLPRNQAPEITAVNVLPSGVALQELPTGIDPSILSSGLDPQVFGLSANIPARRFFQKGARTLTWQASDANDDTLAYNIYYKTLGDADWHLLADNLTQNYYTIDSNRLPDATYTFKIVASDAPSNPDDLALQKEYVTTPVEIDNTPPVIKAGSPVISGSSVEVTFDVTDATSKLSKAEYSVDSGTWKLIFPVDGITDSPHETYKVKVSVDKPGEHVIAFRCSDTSSNVGTSKVTVTR